MSMDALWLYLKRLLYGVLIAGFLFYLKDKLDPLQLTWFAFTVLFLAFITHYTYSILENVLRILVTGTSAALLVYFSGLLMPQVSLWIFSIFILITLILYLQQRYPTWKLPLFFCGLLILLSGKEILNAQENFQRFLVMCAAAGLLIPLQIIFFKSSKSDLFKSETLRQLKRLNDVIFSCLMDATYLDNLYLYERRLHMQKRASIESLQRCAANKKTHAVLDTLFNNMMDYAQLRSRVTDYSTLSVCLPELKAIHAVMSQMFSAVASSKEIKKQQELLTHKINNLEDNYHHVLQVAAREPLVFLLFINSLHGFGESMNAVSQIS